MSQHEGHKGRSIKGDDPFYPNAPGPYVELGLPTCFMFLRAALDAVGLAVTANMMGYQAIGVADHNTLVEA